MFLQRNVASQVFTIPGTLRNIADGTAVTSGASLTWIKDGTSGAAAGTLTHVSDGGYTYQPTQGETDAKICGYILSKTGAVGLAGPIRTTNADPNVGTNLGLSALPTASPGAADGLLKLGTNTAGVTLAPTAGQALAMSSADADVVSITGNAAGAGVFITNVSGGGVSIDAGTAVQLIGETNSAITVTTTTNGVPSIDITGGGVGGYGIRASGGSDAAGRGIFVQGGVAVEILANLSDAALLTAAGTGAALHGVGGGNVITLTTAAATGHAVSATAGIFGDALHLVGGSSAGKAIGATGATGVSITGSTNQGVTITGGSRGVDVNGAQGVSVTASAGVGVAVTGGGNNPGVQYVGGAGGALGHGLALQRGASTADDLNLATSDAPTLGAAWGASVVGNGRTRDYFLQGGWNKTTRTSTTFTVYSSDDTTVLAQQSLTQDATLLPITQVA